MNKNLSFKNIVCSTGEIANNYTEYLMTQHWRCLRKIIYELKKQKCQKCHKEIQEYNVHHLTYKRIGNERITDLQLLCYDCHERIHLSKDEKIDKEKTKKRKKHSKKKKENNLKVKYYCGKYYNPTEARKVSPVIIVTKK